ncbi:MAG: hypothetical protein A2Y62_17355 [Candidatus Fischerbacteria bacterium RBG_13_37_8]|uniref:Calcineurin-like phosphoesterase domain-containing protein n=1 Tax=Candidatus Fischerbacteria bacterium RBG_13_37_8 TaxID=1817863 RepID=A0A1F5VHJ3_9BACT|nr:MAG: hypothetical protein A2Y62_17355 [Candidatus Fischerbacteria bacterium RBG_13_37_8]
MKYLILSDIHSNYEALKSVFASVKRKHFDLTLMLGDLVGYGASPNQVVNIIRSLKNTVVIRGNHDKVAAGLESGNNFNRPASISAKWTYEKLTQINRNYLRKLIRGPLKINDHVSIAHGSPLNEDDYIFSEFDALEVFYNTTAPIIFFGHTHYPIIYSFSNNIITAMRVQDVKQTYALNKNTRYLINPGSIGQPRDRHPYASYAVWDSEKWKVTLYRISYDISSAQQRIIKAGLPSSLAARLSLGV